MDYLIRHLDGTDYDDIIRLWGLTGLPCKLQGRDSREIMGREFKRMDTCFFGFTSICFGKTYDKLLKFKKFFVDYLCRICYTESTATKYLSWWVRRL